MALPGLDLSQASVESEFASAPPTQVSLGKGSEWRFEVAFGTTVRVKLLAGTAELFGTELAASQTYTFSGSKAAIYTWHGCTLEISAGEAISALDNPGMVAAATAAAAAAATSKGGGPGPGPGLRGGHDSTAPTRGYGAGGCQSEYVADETPMVEYANAHFALETLRQEATATGKDGPRALILGPENAGKTSVARILTAYATKMERQPVVVNLDPAEGMLSVPGTLSATAFRTMIDVEEGWGYSPMSGPSAVPVKLPLVYFYPMASPLEGEGAVYRPVVSRLALSVTARMAEDEDARETGIIVDTPGILSQGKPGSLETINHIVTEFSINTILVIGSERLYSAMQKNYDNKPSASASAAASNERISVVKLPKSGGCVDRDAAFMNAVCETQIRTYFFGNHVPSTASAALSLSSASSSTNVTLSPHAQQLDFGGMAVFAYDAGAGAGDDDDDDYDPAQLDSFLPGTTQQDESSSPPSSATITLQKLPPSPPPPALANTLLAITHAAPTASPAEVRDASIMGFLYVADVDVEKRRVRVLAPVGGRVPGRAVVWGRKWPAEVVGLVG